MADAESAVFIGELELELTKKKTEWYYRRGERRYPTSINPTYQCWTIESGSPCDVGFIYSGTNGNQGTRIGTELAKQMIEQGEEAFRTCQERCGAKKIVIRFGLRDNVPIVIDLVHVKPKSCANVHEVTARAATQIS